MSQDVTTHTRNVTKMSQKWKHEPAEKMTISSGHRAVLSLVDRTEFILFIEVRLAEIWREIEFLEPSIFCVNPNIHNVDFFIANGAQGEVQSITQHRIIMQRVACGASGWAGQNEVSVPIINHNPSFTLMCNEIDPKLRISFLFVLVIVRYVKDWRGCCHGLSQQNHEFAISKSPGNLRSALL